MLAMGRREGNGSTRVVARMVDVSMLKMIFFLLSSGLWLQVALGVAKWYTGTSVRVVGLSAFQWCFSEFMNMKVR